MFRNRTHVHCPFERQYLVAILVSLIGAGLFWLLFPAQYEAKAWFYAGPRAPIHYPPGEYETFLADQFAIIKSPQLLEKALSDPRLAQVKELRNQKNPVEWLHKNIFIGRAGKSEDFTIFYRSSIPEDAQAVITAVAHAYLERYEMDVAPSENRFRVIMEAKLQTEPCAQPRLNLTLLVGVGVFWLTLLGGCVRKYKKVFSGSGGCFGRKK